jgi:hypothetical protein
LGASAIIGATGSTRRPAEDEQALAADAIGEAAGGEVRERLRDAEGDDE